MRNKVSDPDGARGFRWVWATRPWVIPPLLMALCGCTSMREFHLQNLPAGGTGRARVVMRDGYAYGFDRVFARGDTLVGIYHVVEERVLEGGDVAYVDLERETTLPGTTVARVEVRHLDWSKSLMLGACGVLFTIWLVGVLDTGDKDAEDHGGKGGSIP